MFEHDTEGLNVGQSFHWTTHFLFLIPQPVFDQILHFAQLNSLQLTFTAYQEFMCVPGCWFWPLSGVPAFQFTVVMRLVWGGTPLWPEICIQGSIIAYRMMPIFCLKPHKIRCLIFTGFSDMPLLKTWWQYCFKSVKLLRNTSSAFTAFHLYRKYAISQKSQKSVF